MPTKTRRKPPRFTSLSNLKRQPSSHHRQPHTQHETNETVTMSRIRNATINSFRTLRRALESFPTYRTKYGFRTTSDFAPFVGDDPAFPHKAPTYKRKTRTHTGEIRINPTVVVITIDPLVVFIGLQSVVCQCCTSVHTHFVYVQLKVKQNVPKG